MKMKILANNNNLYNNLIKRSRILLLLFIILLNGCTTSSKISIFYSGNINGILENCRCPKVSEGSILNHISFYKDSIENVPNSIYLSAGNYFSYNSNDKENKIVLDILDSLGYDLISVGKNDLYFTDSIKNVPVVSFNTSGTLPNKTFKLGKMKICITGMIDPENSKYSNKKIISDKDIGEVAQFIDSLKSESDLLIFISNLEAEKEKRIFNEIKNIDIMISNTNQNNEKYSFGERLYISSGSSAEYIGKLSVEKMKEGVKYKNTFTKMKFDVFHEDKNLKTVIDSLKLKYGIDKK